VERRGTRKLFIYPYGGLAPYTPLNSQSPSRPSPYPLYQRGQEEGSCYGKGNVRANSMTISGSRLASCRGFRPLSVFRVLLSALSWALHMRSQTNAWSLTETLSTRANKSPRPLVRKGTKGDCGGKGDRIWFYWFEDFGRSPIINGFPPSIFLHTSVLSYNRFLLFRSKRLPPLAENRAFIYLGLVNTVLKIL
jgi:hypothetical protein